MIKEKDNLIVLGAYHFGLSILQQVFLSIDLSRIPRNFEKAAHSLTKLWPVQEFWVYLYGGIFLEVEF